MRQRLIVMGMWKEGLARNWWYKNPCGLPFIHLRFTNWLMNFASCFGSDTGNWQVILRHFLWAMRALCKFMLPSKPSTTNDVRQWKPMARLNTFSNEGLHRVTSQKIVWPKKIIPINARCHTLLPLHIIHPNLTRVMMVVDNSFFYTSLYSI